MEKTAFKGKKYSFRKGSFPPLKGFCHHKEEREEKVLRSKVNYFLNMGMLSTYKREGSFIKLEKGIPITSRNIERCSLTMDSFSYRRTYRIVTPTENIMII
jgi:hypothetical protein